ncbi:MULTISPECIES: hypothetical protein [unclassified Prochlorococcus]|uniref:hypothetical protein n=1 Tax=unclassified Prochlorococcus TaxID=2627481 RepID=UPI000533A9B6|nr:MULTISPECIES: hypothetical protein [unclassified Prochlorococcus]KGG16892.1 Glycosyltransferase of PMT family [Prochlorococcus sp. MIT 0602]KGG18133.1 Glycosyltransferase of PMT family [Prochlorococcus sp. MIT 0603]
MNLASNLLSKGLIKNNRRDIILLLSLWLFSVISDLIWVILHQAPPRWDQAFHLSNLYKMSYLLESYELFNNSWWHQILTVTDSYRGPLTYILSTPIFLLLGSTYKAAILSNSAFNFLLIGSIYCLGRFIGSRDIALWGSFFTTFAPALVTQRTDYLIDFSLTSIFSCCWLILTIWNYKLNKLNLILSILAGSFLGLTFLVRPTGIIFLIFPFLIILFKILFSIIKRNYYPIINSLVLSTSFIVIIYPWFSINWLTILTNLNKARQWGISYQEGLEANTLGGFIYYPFLIPKMIGASLVGSILAVFVVSLIFKYRLSLTTLYSKNTSNKSIRLWLLSLPLGGIIICTLMTTKDYRFILPLIPQFCILLATTLISFNLKPIFSRYFYNLLICITLLSFLWNQFGIGFNLSSFPSNKPIRIAQWPLKSIVEEIRRESPNLISTLAVLPDSPYLNAFNLEAEGQRQNALVSARQIVSNINNIQEDLDNFDWFLIKTGDQGIMSNDKQIKLTKLLLDSPSFVVFREWNLPDESKAILLKREPLSVIIGDGKCSINSINVNFSSIPGGLNIALNGFMKQLRNHSIILDFKTDKKTLNFDHRLGQGMIKGEQINDNRCIQISQNFQLNIDSNINEDSLSLQPSVKLISDNGSYTPISYSREPFLYDSSNTNISLSSNRINELLKMGKMLRNGKFDNLFDKVAQINQSDPYQFYLSDAEHIFLYRIQEDPSNLDYLYSLTLTQVLQRKAKLASHTLATLNLLDPSNEYAFLARAIVELYSFHPKNSIELTETVLQLSSDPYIIEIASYVKIIANLIMLNIIPFIEYIS